MIDEDLSEYKVELSEPYKIPGDETASSWAHADTDSRTLQSMEKVTVSLFDRKYDFKIMIHSFHT